VHGFTFEVHFLANVTIEFVEHHAETHHMHVRPARIHTIHDETRQAHVAVHDGLHAGTQHLHDHVAPFVAGTVHLPQGPGGKGRAIEPLYDGIGMGAPRLRQRALDVTPRYRRYAISEGAERLQIRFGNEIRAAREDLGQLHERGAKRCQVAHDDCRALLVEPLRAHGGGTEPQPALSVSQQRDHHRNEPPQNHPQARDIAPRYLTIRHASPGPA